MLTTQTILHTFRAPVGGLFRHVRDLAMEQAARGHRVAIACDSTAADSLTERHIALLAAHCAAGVLRVPMSRDPSYRDASAVLAVRKFAQNIAADVVHGHGAKGGLCARLAASAWYGTTPRPRVYYTPHGGSLHYDRQSLKGRAFLGLERLLEQSTDGLIFESAYAAASYREKIGAPQTPYRVIHNGLSNNEFVPVETDSKATDFLFVGELRMLKGIDVLLHAIAQAQGPRRPTATIVGEGPDGAALRSLARTLGLDAQVQFAGAMPAREAFRRGHVLVVPSRAESLPYIVLEAAAAGKPMIATGVGGIPEIYRGTNCVLIPADDAEALAKQLTVALYAPQALQDTADTLRTRVASTFSISSMTDNVLAFYDGRDRAPSSINGERSLSPAR